MRIFSEIMNRIEKFRAELNRVFDDNLHTKQWHNYVDYAIIGLIVISTIEVFLSTYDNIVLRYGRWLHVVDYATTILFTIEVTLRIWCADLLDEKYKGFWGRVKYCFSFYGLIDVLSTFPFYLNFFFKVPYVALKALRIARLLRIFRYMKAFNILSRAIRAKKEEMVVSLQFLAIVTLILSFILFFVEHAAQPEVYDNGWTSVVWAFAQYIGDPGGFADTPPITLTGRIIACIIGILGIAIFAVPAGLIGSAFTEVMEEDKAEEQTRENIEKMTMAFKHVQCRYTKYLTVPKFISVTDLQAKQRLSLEDVFSAVDGSETFRLRNLATTLPIEDRPQDKLVVETFHKNTDYGCCINRGSKITIVSTSSCSEAATGHFAYYLAKMGGFNYVSKEVEVDPNSPVTYYNITSEDSCPNLKPFLDDIKMLAPTKDSWVIFILSASGGQEPVYPTLFHYIYGAKKGDEGYDDKNLTIIDTESFERMYQDLSGVMVDRYGFESDKHRFHAGTSPRNVARKVNGGVERNAFTIRIAWSVTCWDFRYLEIAKHMADKFNRHLIGLDEVDVPSEMKSRVVGRDYGYAFYEE